MFQIHTECIYNCKACLFVSKSWLKSKSKKNQEIVIGFFCPHRTVLNKTNKNNPVGEKQIGKQDKADRTRLDRTRLDKAGHKTYGDPIYGNEPTRNCKHKEIIKGANKEGDEGEQLGKINQ